MLKRIFKISKAIHKYLGLFLVLYLIWMTITGVILNHPKTVSGLSIPKIIIPEYYHVTDWHRGALRSVCFTDSLTGYAYGKQGVFKTIDGGKSFKKHMGGDFPSSSYYRKTTDIFYEKISKRLIASTKAGFYTKRIGDANWHKLETLKNQDEAIKVIKIKDKLLAATRAGFFVCDDVETLRFNPLKTKKAQLSEYVSLVDLFFKLHDGTIFGFPGKLLWDFFAVILLFLSITAFYLWFWPQRRKRERVKAPFRHKNIFAFFYKYHLKLGIYASLFLVIIVITGMFIHPPLVMLISNNVVSNKYIPHLSNDNPWQDKIINVLYDKGREKLLVDADGLWEADYDLKSDFEKSAIKVSIFAMGSTVFECESDSILLIGSFGGLQRVNTHTGDITNMLPKSNSKMSKRGGLGAYMVTGYFKTPTGQEYFNAHTKGLYKIDGTRDYENFTMPKFMNSDYKMSLWNYAFETHNGRIFKSLVGFFYFFINPLFGLLLVLVLMSGVMDWFIRNGKKKKIHSR